MDGNYFREPEKHERREVENPLDQSGEMLFKSPGGDTVKVTVSGYVNPYNVIEVFAFLGSPEHLYGLAQGMNLSMPLAGAVAGGLIPADEAFERHVGKTVQEVRQEAAENYTITVPDSPADLL